LRDVEQLCDRVALINRGKLLACGTLEELRLSSRQYHRYRLKVTGLSEQNLHQLAHVPGLLKYSKVSQTDGIAEGNQSRDSCALSETLRHMLQSCCEILSPPREEGTETSRTSFRFEGTLSLPTEEPAPWSEQLLPS
jgi:ABC-2 type transport system ATP-binding protein